MANEIPKNESAASAQPKQEPDFQASLDKHGFKLLATFSIVFLVLCLTPTFLVVDDFLKGGTLNEQYQTILFTTFITLLGILITGIFIFMTFRIERGAKIEAREEARNVADEKVNTFVLKAEEEIQSLKAQAIERLEQTEVATTKKIQMLDAQVIGRLEQTEATAAEKIQVLKAQAMAEVKREIWELFEEAAKKMKNAEKGSPSRSGSTG